MFTLRRQCLLAESLRRHSHRLGEVAVEATEGIKSRLCGDILQWQRRGGQQILCTFHSPFVDVFIKRGVKLLVDIVGDIGAVRADSHRQFHDVKFWIEVDLFFFKYFPEAAFKLISPCIVSFLLFPVQIVQCLQHILLPIDKIAEQTQQNNHDKVVKSSHYLRTV